MKTKIFFLFFLLLFSGKLIYAQHAEAEALLSQSKIRIGEQVELKLAVRYHEGTKKSMVTWPEFQDTITQGLEIVKQDSIRTILASRSSVLYQQARSIIITAFDSGTYVIPPQTFIVDKDTVYTTELELYVNTIPVDTTKPIKDIKGIYDVPPPPLITESTSPRHWWWWAIGGFALIVTIALILYFTSRKKTIPSVQNFQRQLLPHERVLEQLAELGRKKPWMHGELKSYHIALT
ncbi:MAG TPA: BatD family protein, partial [Bacteroidia bacterium]|nr:BatD family protein [Bacteroidia bacterium]